MGVEPDPSTGLLEESGAWETPFDMVLEWAPWATLLVGLVLEVLNAIGDPSRLPLTLGLAALAAGWVLFMYTRAGPRREDQRWMRVYIAGLIVIGALMMYYRPGFFPFVITGFIHAFLLKPAPVAFVAVLLNSLVINSRIVYPDGGTEAWVSFSIIVVIQTTAIGFGIIGGEKIWDLSEQRRVAIGELKKVIDENAALQARLLEQARETAVDEERQRLAREIHDTIAQGLTGVITQLEAAGQARGDDVELQRRIDNALHLARDSLGEARRAMRDLLPTALEERALPAALQEVTARWSSLHHVPAELTTTGTTRRLHPEVEVTVLRVTQEALANVAKHAGATRVGVTLSYMGDIVSIDVRDDGIGLDPAAMANGSASGSGFGLTAMRQRVEGLSGTLEVESEPGAGTAVSAFLPAITVDQGSG